MGGIKRSSTMEATIFPKAAPMITPTAKSTTLPRLMNALNSEKRLMESHASKLKRRDQALFPQAADGKLSPLWLTLAFTGSNHQNRRALYVAVLHVAQGTIRIRQSVSRRARLDVGLGGLGEERAGVLASIRGRAT